MLVNPIPQITYYEILPDFSPLQGLDFPNAPEISEACIQEFNLFQATTEYQANAAIWPTT